MGGSKPATTTNSMSPESAAFMNELLGRARPLADRPAMSEDQTRQRGEFADYLQSDKYRKPNQQFMDQGMALMGGGVAGNPFNNGTRMLTQDRNIGNAPYAQDRNGQRSDFSEVRHGVNMQPQGAPPMQSGGGKMGNVIPLMGKMGGSSMAPPDRAMQATMQPSIGGMPMGGQPPMGGMQKPMQAPMAAPNAQMTEEQFNEMLNRNREQYGGGRGG
jgi:hypothetical protein